jgi:hypothetical protein
MCVEEVKKCGAAVCANECSPVGNPLANVTADQADAILGNANIKLFMKLTPAVTESSAVKEPGL